MSREGGQAAIESLVVVPLCLVCALALVDAGVLVRDALALRRATTAAAIAAVHGSGAEHAAREALPAPLGDTLRLARGGDRIELSVASDLQVLDVAGKPRLRADAVVGIRDAGGVA